MTIHQRFCGYSRDTFPSFSTSDTCDILTLAFTHLTELFDGRHLPFPLRGQIPAPHIHCIGSNPARYSWRVHSLPGNGSRRLSYCLELLLLAVIGVDAEAVNVVEGLRLNEARFAYFSSGGLSAYYDIRIFPYFRPSS